MPLAYIFRGQTVRNRIYNLFFCVVSLTVAPLAWADTAGEPGRGANEPNPLNNVYFGEQHLHTSTSVDAYMQGNHKNTIEDAFNYNKGKPVKKWITGETLQRRTAYDWTAVTDHAEYLGVFEQLSDPKNPIAADAYVKAIKSGDEKKQDAAFVRLADTLTSGQPYEPFNNKAMIRTSWEKHKKAMNDAYEPGKFTTLIAFEWTSMPGNQNLHRNVFFRDAEGPDAPFSAFDSDRPEDLWTYLDTQRNAGHECFAISHNGNISNSLMYEPVNSEGLPIDRRYAERRALNEPATEIHQVKSSSDTHPTLSPNDEFANFELAFNGLIGTNNPTVISRIDHGFVRQALISGLKFEMDLGANPFKMGIVGGADSHTALSINEEFNFTGPHNVFDDTPAKRIQGAVNSTGASPAALSSAGSTAVWAPENTREAIFDAIKRKETYGTSGTLIRLRFFGGWNYSKDLTADKSFVKKAYKGGVPMGGDLPKKPSRAKAPTFAVWALKDPESGNLDRVQIVKGWQDRGHGREKVYDVVWSDDRKPDPKTGKLPPVGNSVDVKNASYTNNIGDSQLSAVWTDPDFDPALPAVYYVRVLEIPTPRWSTYDAKTLGIPVPDGIPATIQERAWSSPIWYTPATSKMSKN
jgi:hypothetical protein